MNPAGGLRLAILGAGLLGFAATAFVAARAEIPLDQRRSSYDDMSRDTKAMQDDDTSNPAMLSVLDGEALWNAKAGASGKSCADCHGDAPSSMKGVAARYPAFDETTGRAVNIEQRINLSRERDQKAAPFRYESAELLALTAYIALQSRGEQIAPSQDARIEPFRERGQALFNRRIGQLNLSCAQCHDDHWGKSLAGNLIPQGHPTGYPIYRLEWQSLGSLQRRLRNCMTGVRAEPYALGAIEYVELESFLMWRARGMAMESPGVRP
jgi:sulfur-oxidizing protein SoxA